MRRWAVAGSVLGALLAALLFAPAAWLAEAVAQSSAGHVLLADARGTVWNGHAQLVLTGGAASRDAVALPGRLYWRLKIRHNGIEVQARQACCLHERFRLLATPRIGGMSLVVPALPGALAQWPAAWLAGLGAPWNTLQPAGLVSVSSSSGLSVTKVQGRVAFMGSAELQLQDMSSRLSTLPSVGSYRLSINAQANAGDSASLVLATLKGPLQLSGSGQWGGTAIGTALRFRGLASAEPGFESALANLLNLIGRRQGATSILNIG
jgi:general secretion pathway protein N